MMRCDCGSVSSLDRKVENHDAIPAMKKKAIAFNADNLIRSVEEVRDAVTRRRKLTLRTTRLSKPALSSKKN